MGVQLLAVTAVLFVVVQTLEGAVAPVHNVLVKPGNAQKCVCMNGKWCEGEIINDVQCHPSYIMVCCIQPEPEPNPPYPLYPTNRFETEPKETEKEKPQPLQPVVAVTPLLLENLPEVPENKPKVPEVPKKTTPLEASNKGDDSSEPSSESNEEIDSSKEKETVIGVFQLK